MKSPRGSVCWQHCHRCPCVEKYRYVPSALERHTAQSATTRPLHLKRPLLRLGHVVVVRQHYHVVILMLLLQFPSGFTGPRPLKFLHFSTSQAPTMGLRAFLKNLPPLWHLGVSLLCPSISAQLSPPQRGSPWPLHRQKPRPQHLVASPLPEFLFPRAPPALNTQHITFWLFSICWVIVRLPELQNVSSWGWGLVLFIAASPAPRSVRHTGNTQSIFAE